MKRPSPEIAGASDIGRKRKENQDHFLIAKLRRHLQVVHTDVESRDCDELFGIDDGHLLVVADGMGGHSDGAMASDRAVKACSRHVLDMMEWFLKLSPENEDDFIDELKLAINAAQNSIWGKDRPTGKDSGTTVTMAYVLARRLYVVHAGDSRCYLLRGGELKQLTTDHTLAQKLLDEGALTSDEAETSRWRHVLWNCVGGREQRVQAEVSKVALEPDDQVLMCSDGLTGMIGDEQITKLLQESVSCEEAVDRLIEVANEAGGNDNISVIVARDLVGPSQGDSGCFPDDSLAELHHLEDTADI